MKSHFVTLSLFFQTLSTPINAMYGRWAWSSTSCWWDTSRLMATLSPIFTGWSPKDDMTSIRGDGSMYPKRRSISLIVCSPWILRNVSMLPLSNNILGFKSTFNLQTVQRLHHRAPRVRWASDRLINSEKSTKSISTLMAMNNLFLHRLPPQCSSNPLIRTFGPFPGRLRNRKFENLYFYKFHRVRFSATPNISKCSGPRLPIVTHHRRGTESI